MCNRIYQHLWAFLFALLGRVRVVFRAYDSLFIILPRLTLSFVFFLDERFFGDLMLDLKLPFRGNLTIHDGGTIILLCLPESTQRRFITSDGQCDQHNIMGNTRSEHLIIGLVRASQNYGNQYFERSVAALIEIMLRTLASKVDRPME